MININARKLAPSQTELIFDVQNGAVSYYAMIGPDTFVANVVFGDTILSSIVCTPMPAKIGRNTDLIWIGDSMLAVGDGNAQPIAACIAAWIDAQVAK